MLSSLLVFYAVVLLWVGVDGDKCEVATECVTDLSQADCEPGFVLVPNSTIFNCCPGCVPESEAPTPRPTLCQAPSNCLENGDYAPVQCKGDLFVGRCFCSDRIGARIFGQMWRIDADHMTCACSRRRAELEAAGRTDVTLHCTQSGDYERLQCDGGICWCADPKTGASTITPVVQADVKRLPCYDANIIGEQYLRRCESVVYATALVHKEQSEHGTIFHGITTTSCDYDGSYGPVQISGTSAWCTSRDGQILGSWQVEASQRAGMNCNCARDSSIYYPEHGMTFPMQCSSNGNYQPNQMSGDLYYCVDSDGYPTTDYSEAWPEDNCASWT